MLASDLDPVATLTEPAELDASEAVAFRAAQRDEVEALQATGRNVEHAAMTP